MCVSAAFCWRQGGKKVSAPLSVKRLRLAVPLFSKATAAAESDALQNEQSTDAGAQDEGDGGRGTGEGGPRAGEEGSHDCSTGGRKTERTGLKGSRENV